eukprot:230133_1
MASLVKQQLGLVISGFIKEIQNVASIIPSEIKSLIAIWLTDTSPFTIHIHHISHQKHYGNMGNNSHQFCVWMSNSMVWLVNAQRYKFSIILSSARDMNADLRDDITCWSKEVYDCDNHCISFIQFTLNDKNCNFKYKVSAVDERNNIINQTEWAFCYRNSRRPPPIPCMIRRTENYFTLKIDVKGNGYVTVIEWLNALKLETICNDINELDYKRLFYYMQHTKKEHNEQNECVLTMDAFRTLVSGWWDYFQGTQNSFHCAVRPLRHKIQTHNVPPSMSLK